MGFAPLASNRGQAGHSQRLGQAAKLAASDDAIPVPSAAFRRKPTALRKSAQADVLAKNNHARPSLNPTLARARVGTGIGEWVRIGRGTLSME
jgi:hypothetical protein